jgi:hypothetical protein
MSRDWSTYEIELNVSTYGTVESWVAELHLYEGEKSGVLEKTRIGVFTAPGKEEARRYAIFAMNEHKNKPKDDPVFTSTDKKKYVVQSFFNYNVRSHGPVNGKGTAEILLRRLEKHARANGYVGSGQIIELESPDIPKMFI